MIPVLGKDFPYNHDERVNFVMTMDNTIEVISIGYDYYGQLLPPKLTLTKPLSDSERRLFNIKFTQIETFKPSILSLEKLILILVLT